MIHFGNIEYICVLWKKSFREQKVQLCRKGLFAKKCCGRDVWVDCFMENEIPLLGWRTCTHKAFPWQRERTKRASKTIKVASPQLARKMWKDRRSRVSLRCNIPFTSCGLLQMLLHSFGLLSMTEPLSHLDILEALADHWLF